MINTDYLQNLNKAQKEAVLYLDGPLLIVAGAGSGKTKVLTSRIAHIIKKNRAFPKLVNPAMAPLASVTTDILKEKRAIIPVSNTPVAM